MEYRMKKLNNRIAKLDDSLVDQYLKVEDEIRENNFFIVIKSKFGHIPTEEELPERELSEICNEVLLSQLKLFAVLPQAISYAEENRELFKENAKKGIRMKHSLKAE